MSDPVALALIAMAGTVAGNLILTWRVVVVAKEAASKASEDNLRAVKAIDDVHESVNGGWAHAKAEIVDLKAEIERMKLASLTEQKAADALGRLREIRGEET